MQKGYLCASGHDDVTKQCYVDKQNVLTDQMLTPNNLSYLGYFVWFGLFIFCSGKKVSNIVYLYLPQCFVQIECE